MVLYNRINGKVLKENMLRSHEIRVTLSFYKYHHLSDPQAFRDELFKLWNELGVLGRTYVAAEGINAQISVPQSRFKEFRDHLYSYPFLNGIRLNIAVEDNGKSFFKLKIQVKHKILADGLDDASFDVTNSGKHLKAKEFNALAERDDTVIIDMRNHYESEVGHFKNAITPDVDTFRDSLPVVEEILKPHREKNIIMYCTGGIRCEKASAWFKHRGFKNIFQLEGGIIEYARQAQEEGLENKFIGKNFVFDERLGERISEEVISHCHQCGEPCDTHTNCKNDGCHLLFIQCEKCKAKYDACCSTKCADIIQLPEEKQKEIRKGINNGRQVFKKGRAGHLIEKLKLHS
ncbi:MAG TPA: rhodanese-related sulfurtransferase [Cyclobacteriaceae bacterium]|nr:rhodanese-related sulfurtransferase [Cyclobacteriaceae bacterium]